MSNDSKEAKLVLVCVPDEDVLTLLRDFLEPLGYQVEFAPDMKKRRESAITMLKGAAGAVLFMLLDKIEAGTAICLQLRPT